MGSGWLEVVGCGAGARVGAGAGSGGTGVSVLGGWCLLRSRASMAATSFAVNGAPRGSIVWWSHSVSGWPVRNSGGVGVGEDVSMSSASPGLGFCGESRWVGSDCVLGGLSHLNTC